MKSAHTIKETRPKVLIAEPSYYVAQIYSKELMKLGYLTTTYATAEQMLLEYKKEIGMLGASPFLAVIVDEKTLPRGDLVVKKIHTIMPSQKILYTVTRPQTFTNGYHPIIEIIEKPFTTKILVRKLEEAKLGRYN